jgi:hypothetical protein
MKNKIESIKKQVLNIPLTVEEFASVVRSEVDDLGVEVSVQYANGFPKDTVSTNGYFNPYDWEYDYNIELELITSDEEDTININIDNWDFLAHQMIQTLEHEIIHRNQITKRQGFVVLPEYIEGMSTEQERIIYLSNPDEIDAYANDVALDLLEVYTTQGACLKLSKYTYITKEESVVFNEYMELFGANSDIVKTIVKKALSKITT